MSDWAALYRSLTADTLDSVDTLSSPADAGSLPADTLDSVDTVSTAHADACPLTADTLDSVDTLDEAPPSERQSVNCVQSVNVSKEEKQQAATLAPADSVNSVQSVNVSKGEEEEATTSPLATALAALERRCPDHIEAADWQRAVEDGRRFLIQWGEQATALGWAEADVFGLPPVPENLHPMWRRLARLDQLGLVWLTHGRPVTSITAAHATIATPKGGSVAFYRLQARLEAQQTSDAGVTVVNDPTRVSNAAKPSYEVIGRATIGQQCALCNSSIGA